MDVVGVRGHIPSDPFCEFTKVLLLKLLILLRLHVGRVNEQLHALLEPRRDREVAVWGGYSR